MRERNRQFIHILLGIFFMFILFLFGRTKLIYLLSGMIFFGFLLVYLILLGYRIPAVSWFVDKFERREAKLPGYGSAWFSVGVLLILLLIPDIQWEYAAITVLALGDGLSTIIGRTGKIRLPYNPVKTLEGSLAFFFGSLLSAVFIGWYAVPLAFLCAVAESFPIFLDDNLMITLTAAALYNLLFLL